MYPSLAVKRNPFLSIFASSLADAGYETERWRWFPPIQAPSIVILHWAEHLWLPASSPYVRVKKAAQRTILAATLRGCRRQGTKVIFVAHNAVPHAWEGPSASWRERIKPLWADVDAVLHFTHASMTNTAFEDLRQLPSAVIPHPHYDLVDPKLHAARAGSIKRVAFVRGLERRKKVLEAVQTFLALDGINVFVSGPGDARPFAELRGRQVTERLEIHPTALTDDALHAVFDGGTAVVLSQGSALNSGVLWLALSRGAPVFCPETPTNREIQSQVGPEWIRLFNPPLRHDDAAALLNQPVPSRLPDLSSRSPGANALALRAFIDRLK